MNIPRKKLREAVFYFTYSRDFVLERAEKLDLFMEQLKMSKRNIQVAYERSLEILDFLSEIDDKIASFSKEYPIERISKVERTVMRLGVYEMLFDSNIPEVVAISEALRLCKKYGSPEGCKFVNGLLDSIYKSTQTCNQGQTCELVSDPI